MIYKYFHIVLITIALSILSPGLVSGESRADSSDSGLEVVKTTRHGEVLARPDTNWSAYTHIQIEKATVTFRKNWARDQKNRNGNRPTAEGMDRIKMELSELLDEVFKQELTQDNAFAAVDSGG